jgi:hypothetical protein
METRTAEPSEALRAPIFPRCLSQPKREHREPLLLKHGQLEAEVARIGAGAGQKNLPLQWARDDQRQASHHSLDTIRDAIVVENIGVIVAGGRMISKGGVHWGFMHPKVHVLMMSNHVEGLGMKMQQKWQQSLVSMDVRKTMERKWMPGPKFLCATWPTIFSTLACLVSGC